VIEKDMPQAMQRIRESLWVSKVKFVEEEKKNVKGFVVGAKFTVPAAAKPFYKFSSSPSTSERKKTEGRLLCPPFGVEQVLDHYCG